MNSPEHKNDRNDAKRDGTPEPPERYRPQDDREGPFVAGGGVLPPDYEFDNVRRLATTAQILALVSLVIGGVLLGTAAVILAIIAYRRMTAYVSGCSDEASRVLGFALKRATTIALIICVLALGVNIASLIALYPMLVDFMQTGDYAALFGGTQPAGSSSSSSGSTFWG